MEYLLAIILLSLFLFDFLERTLPDVCLVFLLVLGITLAFQNNDLFQKIATGTASFLFFLIIRQGYYFTHKNEGLGFGDVKLLGVAGVLTGFPGIIWVLLMGSLGTLLFALGYFSLKGKIIQKFKLPLGSFLSLAITNFLYFPNLVPEIYLT